ncbi:MAG: SDR family NAD(P)-dependent oxidoreductase [Bacteriovoracaceae bacterium]
MQNLSNLRALITGASSGIGRAMAFCLAQMGCELFLLARRSERLEEVKNDILKLYPHIKIHLIVADINSESASEKVRTITQEKIDILINNAGLALGRDKVESANFSDFETMINTNITANFKMIHLILPWMLKHGQGDIINLCSVAGHYTYQGGSVYCATKHAVNAFTRVLREETCGKNIRVMQISPGMVETEFSVVRFKGDEKLAQDVYAHMKPLTAEDIAEMMSFMLTRPRHVVIDEIITMPMSQGSPTTVVRNDR